MGACDWLAGIGQRSSQLKGTEGSIRRAQAKVSRCEAGGGAFELRQLTPACHPDGNSVAGEARGRRAGMEGEQVGRQVVVVMVVLVVLGEGGNPRPMRRRLRPPGWQAVAVHYLSRAFPPTLVTAA